MNKKSLWRVRSKLVITFALLIFAFTYKKAQAVPPPDFIFSAGTQIAQIFGIAILFLSAAFSMIYQFIKAKIASIGKHQRIFIGVSLLGITVIATTFSYLYNSQQEKQAYQKWLAESNQYTELSESRKNNEEITNEVAAEEKQSLDILHLGSAPTDNAKSGEPFTSGIDASLKNSASAQFIERYYKTIAEGQLSEAYALSKKSVNEETFKGWYTKTTRITLDHLTQIDEKTSSLELTLYEGPQYTRYGVLMTLKLKDGSPIQVEKSNVRILSEGSLEEKGDQTTAKASMDTFYSKNESSSLSISHEAFRALEESGRTDYIVVDARENLEYENGYFPGSIHIRYADLQAGRWIDLPTDKFVYVICWSGIRGQEVTKFLRTKNVLAFYLEGGASGWVANGGEWVGNINFIQKYTEDRYKVTYTTEQTKKYHNEGVILVDAREPWRYNQKHIEGSINIPMMYTPTIDMETRFSQVPPHSTVITVCDDYVNCFDAKVTGVELEQRGHTFIGRYNKPWEY